MIRIPAFWEPSGVNPRVGGLEGIHLRDFRVMEPEFSYRTAQSRRLAHIPFAKIAKGSQYGRSAVTSVFRDLHDRAETALESGLRPVRPSCFQHGFEGTDVVDSVLWRHPLSGFAPRAEADDACFGFELFISDFEIQIAGVFEFGCFRDFA